MKKLSHNLIAAFLGIVAALTITSCSTTAQRPPDLLATKTKPQYLYAVDGAGISAYRINASTGALTQVPGSPFATTNAIVITVNPAGTFAYSQDFSSGTISAYRINADTGGLTPVDGSPFSTAADNTQMVINPSGTFAYVASASSHTISGYRIDASTGALNPIPRSPFFVPSDGLVHITMDPSGSFIYTNTGYIFSIDASSGALTPVRGRVTGLKDLAQFAISPNGRFAYAAETGRVLEYRVNTATGALTPMQGSPFKARPATRCECFVMINRAGTVAYVSGSDIDAVPVISAFSINTTTGALTEIQGSPFAFGGTLARPVLGLSGDFIYQGGQGKSIFISHIEHATGAITGQVMRFPVRSGSVFMAIAQP